MTTVSETVSATRETIAQTYGTAKDTVAGALETVSDTAAQAYDSTKQAARATTARAADGIDANPISVLVGGIAVGVLAAALLPRTRKEAELLGPVGRRIADTATAAASAARQAGQEQLDTLGLNKDAAKEQVSRFVDGVTKAATSAGTAAVGEVKAATETAQPMTSGTSSQQY